MNSFNNAPEVVHELNNIIASYTGQYLDPALIDVVLSAKRIYEKNSPREISDILRNVCAEEEYGVSHMAYEVSGRDDIHELGDKVRIYKMYFINGEFHPPSLVKEYYAETERCSQCGVITHCTEKVNGLKGEGLEYCNHCMSMDDILRTMSGGTKKCELCSTVSCTHHPDHNIVDIRKRA